MSTPVMGTDDGVVREFCTGATRDTSEDKYDYEGFLSPVVLEAYAEYMHGHRKQTDGRLRDSDNWQKGMPKSAYMKSAWRHFMALWSDYRQGRPIVEHCLALMFNIMGLVHETLKEAADVKR